MAVTETDDVSCPRCGASLAGVLVAVVGDVGKTGMDAELRTHSRCPECDAPVDVVVASNLPDDLGVDVFVEDGHRRPGEDRRDRVGEDDVEGDGGGVDAEGGA